MKVLNAKRGSGKTTKAIDFAYLTGSLLVVPTNAAVSSIQEKADKYLKETYNAEPGSVTVMCVSNVIDGKAMGFDITKNLVIDELDAVIDVLFKHSGVVGKTLLATRTEGDY